MKMTTQILIDLLTLAALISIMVLLLTIASPPAKQSIDNENDFIN